MNYQQSKEGQAFFATSGHGGFTEPREEDRKLLDRVLPETRRLLKLEPKATPPAKAG